MASQTQAVSAISAAELARTLGPANHPLVIDVRHLTTLAASQHLICGSLYRPPENASAWGAELPAGKPMVVTCAHGHEVGQNAAMTLRAAGIDARYLSGGVEGWIERTDFSPKPAPATPSRSIFPAPPSLIAARPVRLTP